MIQKTREYRVLEDKERWNTKYQTKPMSGKVAKVVQKYLQVANVGDGLDIACGIGRHTHFMVDHGFKVDAVDYSDYALSKIRDIPEITKIDTDLDTYEIPADRYDLIVNCNYLERRLFPQIKAGLKKEGVVIFETFVDANDETYSQPSNPDFLLRKNELLEVFSDLEIIYYEERDEINQLGEKVKVASLVARRLSE